MICLSPLTAVTLASPLFFSQTPSFSSCCRLAASQNPRKISNSSSTADAEGSVRLGNKGVRGSLGSSIV